MTNEELQHISLSKKVDRITLVTDNIHQFIRNMTEYFRLGPWTVDHVTAKSGEICWHEAILPLANEMEIQVVEPVSESSVYMDFFRRYGKGFMGVRERVAPDQWDTALTKYTEMGFKMAWSPDHEYVWVDMMDSLGGIIGFIRDDSPMRPVGNGKNHICQICLVTDDILRTAHDMSTLLNVGPWEIGNANNQTFTDMECGGYQADDLPESAFTVGIGMYGSLQVELIQPLKGPVPYFGFLNRRGVGFHHFKQQLSRKDYQESIVRLRGLGLKPALAGKISGCPWCNWATEELFGFIYEMNDDSILDRLPDGYNPYFVQ